MKSITQTLSQRLMEFVILPPAGAAVPGDFEAIEMNDRLHASMLANMQRFRGAIYLRDGAVSAEQLTPDGRHCLPVDQESWHVLTVNEERRICACLRLHQEREERAFEELPIADSPLTDCPVWGPKLRQAVQSEITTAGEAQLRFGDVGGWAIAPDRRRTLEPVRTILAAYGLAQHLGGFRGIATATCKHGSSEILRKLGLRPLRAAGENIPMYYDTHYNSQMEALSFDSRRPNPKYNGWIAELRACLSRALVIASSGRSAGLAFSAGASSGDGSELWNHARFAQAGSAVA